MMRRIAAALVLLLALVRPAFAEELINLFASDVTVNSDGSLDVRETITFTAEGFEIKRGLLRDIPTQYRDREGARVQLGLEVLSVTRDGAPETYAVSSFNNGVRIQIGNKDVFLDHGQHSYVISYRTTRQLGFFPAYDELYWNVTGNGWTLPIEAAQAVVRLPDGASIQQHSVYTGSFGEAGTDARVTSASGSYFSAETTRRLEPGEGLTVAVAWQKGIVSPPSEAQQRWWWLADNLGYFLAGFTLLTASIYYLFAWLKVGRDPPTGVIVPLFHPPEGLGPAGTRYVWRQGYDNEAFAAALVGLAVKGRVKISEEDGEYAVTSLADQGPPLTRSEQALFRQLPVGKLVLKQSNHARVGAARSALRNSLDDEFDGTMFLKNFWWFAAGALISAVGLLVAGLLTPQGEGAGVWFAALFGSIWWGVILGVGWGSVKGFFGAQGFFTKIKSLMGMIFLVPFVGAGIFVPATVIWQTDIAPMTWFFIWVAVALALVNLLFYWLLKAPTVKGRAMLDQIEGFRLYMTTAEEERLKVLHPPEKTPELFQRYLPYAMALDCENEWNAKFASVLAAAAAAGVATTPIWYNGSNWNSGGFSRDLGGSLASAISSSATAPGSSSGSGGGGFSGGGGGGGGGSGW